ncbi:MAG: hypothetical protein MJ252_16370 [archaeon]|nr:hypothetical protein [archaeon]
MSNSDKKTNNKPQLNSKKNSSEKRPSKHKKGNKSMNINTDIIHPLPKEKENKENNANIILKSASSDRRRYSKSFVDYVPLTEQQKEKTIEEIGKSSSNRFRRYSNLFDQIKKEINDINELGTLNIQNKVEEISQIDETESENFCSPCVAKGKIDYNNKVEPEDFKLRSVPCRRDDNSSINKLSASKVKSSSSSDSEDNSESNSQSEIIIQNTLNTLEDENLNESITIGDTDERKDSIRITNCNIGLGLIEVKEKNKEMESTYSGFQRWSGYKKEKVLKKENGQRVKIGLQRNPSEVKYGMSSNVFNSNYNTMDGDISLRKCFSNGRSKNGSNDFDASVIKIENGQIKYALAYDAASDISQKNDPEIKRKCESCNCFIF